MLNVLEIGMCWFRNSAESDKVRLRMTMEIPV